MVSETLFVIGHPVAHSKSPAMHNTAYRALGLDWDYGFADCADEESAKSRLATRDWIACNITMPWKPLAYSVADVRSIESNLAQGANVLVNHESSLYADNTDGKGCIAYLQRRGVSFSGARVSVCGTGPTSLAIMHAAVKAGAGIVGLHGRNAEKTEAAIGAYRERAGYVDDVVLEARAYDDEGLRSLAASDVILDATPLGMKAGDPAPFDVSVLSARQVVFDVVYGHGETALMAAARDAGCMAIDGAGMLVAQAVETVRDIAEITRAFEVPDDMDLFAIMAQAAGFDL